MFKLAVTRVALRQSPLKAKRLYMYLASSELLEGISKIPEQDDKAGEVDETEEVFGVILVAD